MASDDPFSPPRRRRPSGAVIGYTIVFIAGIVLAALAIRQWGDRVPWLVPAAVQPVPVKVAVPPAAAQVDPAAELDTLAAREAALSARLADLEARSAAIDTKADAASGNATRAEGLLVAFAARRAIDRGIGLGYIEGQLRERFGATQPRAVATIIKTARSPVTIEDLRLGLDSIAPDLVSGGHDALWSGLRNALSNLIVLHKAGSPSPRPSARMMRARRLLEAGQVEAALAEIERLPGASGAQRWIAAAKRYINVRRALDVIETAAILGQGAPVAAPITSAPSPPPAANAPPPAAQPADSGASSAN
jgi:hypothetical protein